jgi:hypothetical protein
VKNSVWQYACIRKGWRGIWDRITFIPTAIKYTHQRAVRGFCDADTYDAGDSIDAYLIGLLTRFTEMAADYPISLFDTHEEWIAEINSILADLRFCAEDPDELNPLYSAYRQECLPMSYSNWTERERELYNDYLKEAQRIIEEQNALRPVVYSKVGMYIKHLWW